MSMNPQKNKVAQYISHKSKQRIRDHGEVFTHRREITAMLEFVKQETERIESRFLEPACGTGSFLAEILRGKLENIERRYKKSQLEYELYAVLAVSNIYGLDILEDNIRECRESLLRLFNRQYTRLFRDKCKAACKKTISFLLTKNIVLGDALTFKTPDSRAVILSEWSPVNNILIKRRDFALANLLKNTTSHLDESLTPLNEEISIPTPIAEYPVEHFLKLGAV